MGWLPFDVRICKFEFEQWCAAFNINLDGAMGPNGHGIAELVIEVFEIVIENVVAEQNSEIESSVEGAED